MISILTLCLCLLAAPALARSTDSDNLAADRERFGEAYEALKAGRQTQAATMVAGLENYPLYTYFRHHELSRQLTKKSEREVRQFLAAYDASVLATRLRRQWLKLLSRERQWDVFLHDYRPQTDVKLKCDHLSARIAVGALEGVLGDAKALWLVGKSQPGECDVAFKFLQTNNVLDDHFVWQRIRLSIENDKSSLASYLARQLKSADLRAFANIWVDAHKSPEATLKRSYFAQDDVQVREIVLHAIKRIARSDVKRGSDRWAKLLDRYQFSDTDRGLVERVIGVAAARQGHSQRIAYLDKITRPFVDDTTERYRIREGIKTNSWAELERWTERPPIGTTALLRWRYWRARALQFLDRDQDANVIFAELAKERDYYGYLSADHLGLAYQMNDRPIVPTAVELADLRARPGIIRARELVLSDMRFEARREWVHEIESLTPRQLEIAAFVVNGWGWHDRAILALGKAKAYDDLSIRFPLPHKDLARKYAAKRNLDVADIYSIIRTESAFMTDARSPAGALGLMQLMPATGRETARRVGGRLKNVRELLEPTKNIMLGSAYLQQVLGSFGDSFSLAAAAYNAGPSHVKSWLPKSGCVPADIWIDTIPFTETRRYVRRAAFYATVYQWRLHQEIKPLAARLTDAVPKGGNQKC
jgi:soluble lytic murein transglycosylase